MATIDQLLELFPDVFRVVEIDGVIKVALINRHVADKPKTSNERAVTMLKPAEFQKKLLNAARLAETSSTMSLNSVGTVGFLNDIAGFPQSTPQPSQVDTLDDDLTFSDSDCTLFSNTIQSPQTSIMNLLSPRKLEAEASMIHEDSERVELNKNIAAGRSDGEGIFEEKLKDEDSLTMSLLEMSLSTDSTVSKNYKILEESASEAADDPLDMAMALISECSSNTIPQEYQLQRTDSDVDESEWDENYEFEADEEAPIYDSKAESSDEDEDNEQTEEQTSSESAIEPAIVKQLSASQDPKAYIASLAVDHPVFLLGFDEVIEDPKIQLPFQKLLEGEIDIHISEVFSPIHFWFQQGVGAERLMDRMEKVYKELNERALIISEKNIQPGLLVACYLEEFTDWHRAMVINRIDEKGNVRLFFLDYGTVGFVKLRNIKYLFKTFLKYPRMAHRGRFHNLKPPTNPIAWSEEDVNEFIIKIANEKFKAVVLKTDEEQVHEIDIMCNGESLREWLINRELASPFDFNNPKYPKSTYPMCYFFPTFEMLESNYPTFTEKSSMSERGIDFDLLLETNYLTCMPMKKLTSSPKLLTMLSLEEFQDAKAFYFPNV